VCAERELHRELLAVGSATGQLDRLAHLPHVVHGQALEAEEMLGAVALRHQKRVWLAERLPLLVSEHLLRARVEVDDPSAPVG
jgi:hypothetical protein